MLSLFRWLMMQFRLMCLGREGNIAITFAIALIPIFAAAGAAVDYSRLSNELSHLKQAIDSAVLAAAARDIKTDDERISIAQKFFRTNIQNPCGEDAIFTIKDSTVTGAADCNIQTTFLNVIGIQKLNLSAESIATIPGIKNQEIVLVLDYSRSMKSRRKYITMRDAAIDLVNSISNSSNGKNIKIGLVPFSHHVYVTLPSDHVKNEVAGGSWTNCTMDRKYPYNTTDQTPVTKDDETKWGLDKYSECSEYRRRSLIVRPLTTDHSAIISQLNAMTPYRSTHISLGLSFGWHVISPNAPFTQGANYFDAKMGKTIILLTDGKQTQKAWGQYNSWSRRNGEENLEILCAGVKNNGITMVTVAFDLDDEPTVNRLKQCASGSQNFYDVENTGELVAAFSKITDNIFEHARLTK